MAEKGLSTRQVAKNCRHQVTSSYVGKITSGDSKNLTVEKLQGLALGLGVAEEEIFRVARGLPIDPNAEYNSEDNKMLAIFRRLKPARRREVVAFANMLDSFDHYGVGLVPEQAEE
jgi:transcriptional regulator with XRE-family HTH domain